MTEPVDPQRYAHFKGKDAITHVIEAQAQGIVASSEIHGTEIPGHISAGADAARETAIALLLLWILLSHFGISPAATTLSLTIFAFGWLLWKGGRGAWLGWSRLERLHRVVAEEKWEIEHNRQQERDELRVLYQAKGFEGKLLEDVLDVLMADGDRLLKVMVEEELGLHLGVHEHPLKQSLGAALGVLIALVLCVAPYSFFPTHGIWVGAAAAIAGAAAVSAAYEGNKQIPAIVWNLGLAALACGGAYFLLTYFSQG